MIISSKKFFPTGICLLKEKKNIICLALHILSAIFFSAEAFGQTGYNNDWINYDQTYFKLAVAQDGIYKISQAELSAAGFPVSADPRNIQIFHRGKEQAVLLEGQNDGTFDPSDFILFFGQRNDGATDTDLYVSPEAQPHTYYNLFSDTSAYFITAGSTAGKRMSVVNEDLTGLPSVNHHTDEKLTLYTQNYWKGREYSADTYLSQYDYGEGWTGTHFRGGQFRDVVFKDITNIFSAGENPKLEIELTGRNANMHSVEILVGPSTTTLRSLTTLQFVAHENHLVSAPLNWSDISAGGQLVVRVLVQTTAVTDFISIAAVKLQFGQQLQMQSLTSKVFRFQDVDTKSQVTILNTPTAVRIYDITNSDDVTLLNYSVASTDVSTVLYPSTETLFVSNQVATVPSLKKVNFQEISPAAHNFLIVTNSLLRENSGSSEDPVAAYAAYRASVAGGSFSPLVVDIRQLYDQFYFGEVSPLAIREFARYMYDQGDLDFLFIIGKGLSIIYDYYRKGPSGIHHNLVPTYGEPGSDIAFTAGLDNANPYTPAIPVGRLTAQTPQQVLDYLNKVKEIEAVPYNALWRKNLVHLSGGATESELVAFKQYVNEFKVVAENQFLGGNVITKSKKTNFAVELINIAEEVNKGVALVTFFGHSGALSTDMEIGYVSDADQGYVNQGKYPFILVNGCDAGNIFSNVYTFGQDWIVTPDKGAIGFIAHSAKGLSSTLKKYTDQFYASAFADSSLIDKSVGEILQKAINQYILDYSASSPNISQVQQMVLQGDPALKLFGLDKPDFEINADHIAVSSFDERRVTALSDSFYVEIIPQNFGITTQDPLNVQITRKFANGTLESYDSIFAPVFYSDTLKFTVKNFSVNENFGENEFEVFLDHVNATREADESNNIASLNFFVTLGGTTNLYPHDFAIVNSNSPELIAQSNDVLEDGRTFLFEIDTVKSFNSPALQQTTVTAQALSSWKPALIASLASDSIVYFWRTKFANVKAGEDSSWAVSSFVYIKESPEGWAQKHFSQFDRDAYLGLVQNSSQRTFEFVESSVPIDVVTYGDLHSSKTSLDIKVFVNNIPIIVTAGFKVCRNNAIGAIAFDKSSGEPYLLFNKTSYNDPIACGRSPFIINNFDNNEIVNKRRFNAYIDAVSEGDFILLFSIGRNTYESWPAEVKDALFSVGATPAIIDNIKNGEPYILLGKKGGEALAEITGARENEIAVNDFINPRFTSGVITSPNIGPAKQWGTMVSKVRHSENPENDQFSYDVIGVDLKNQETLLFEDITVEEINLESIDANTYPLIKVKIRISDKVDLTPVQLKKWMVFYEPMPEGVLLLDSDYKKTLPGIEKMEGEEVTVGYTFKNISDKNFDDSLTISYSVFNKSSKSTEEKKLKAAPLAAKDTLMFSVPISTVNKKGTNNLKVYVNPRVLPEQNYNNNIIDLPDYLTVKGDTKHPTVDVSFDGTYIMDGDIVSPDPLIAIVMKDDATFLLKKDTMGVEILLKKPCETCVFEKINFSSPNVIWAPATKDSDFKVEFKPGILEDGIYSLKVQASDASGNLSGSKPYSVNFEVISESSITNFYPYPNPFSTSTKFIFTLTGSEIPSQIKIQIMTVTGKIVREITQNELGPVKIGNNISDYAWNGRDEFGDQLANGVYLYRVIVVNNGENLKHRETSADRAFKNGYGKMYLLR